MKELILIKEAKNGVTKFDQNCIILKGIKKYSHRLQNVYFRANILQIDDFSKRLSQAYHLKLCIKRNTLLNRSKQI